MRELLHADDQWAQISEHDGAEWNVAHVKTELESQIEEEMSKRGIEGGQAAFMRERMRTDRGSMDERYQRASKEVHEDCPSYMHQLSVVKNIVDRVGEQKRVLEPKRGDGVITCGEANPIGRLRGTRCIDRQTAFSCYRFR